MKILQKKGLQLRKQGQEIGKVSFLQTQSRRIVKERREKSPLQLPDTRAARAWETLPEMKKAKILSQAGGKSVHTAFLAYQKEPESRQASYFVEQYMGIVQEIREEALPYENEPFPFLEEYQSDAFNDIALQRMAEDRQELRYTSSFYENTINPFQNTDAFYEAENTNMVPVLSYPQEASSYGADIRTAARGTAIGAAAAGALAPGERIAVQIPQVLEDMRKTANDYEELHSAEGQGAVLSDRERIGKKGTGNTGAVNHTVQKAGTKKIQRRVMRKLSRKLMVQAVAANSGKEEDMQAVQASHTLSEKAMVSVQKLFKAVLKSLGRSLAALIAAFPPIGLLLILCFFLIVIITAIGGSQQLLSARAVNLSQEVEEYRSTVQEIAGEYNMSDYVELLLAVMMTESGGRGNDPMQASEGGYNTQYPRRPNGITDPIYSIECGVQELRDALVMADVSSPTDMVNIRIALQGYNFGPGFITWFRNKGYTEWSFEIACEFAESTGWGRRSDPNHVAGPWAYGDQYYPEHVLRYYVVSAGNAELPENGLPIPIYYQWEYQDAYGSSTIAQAGCGPSCFAMVASYLRGETITPADVVAWCGNTYYVPGAGTSWSFFAAAAEHYGIGTVTTTISAEAVMRALGEGHPVISSQSPGLFTGGGHFIVLRGITADGKILVNDPNDNDRKQYLNREFDMYSEIDCTSRNYWIFEAKQ